MGRGKKKRVAKRRRKMFNRNAIRVKMGEPIFFTLTHCSKKLGGVSNKYNYKANMHKLCFVGARFYNVKYQASIMTNCNFRNANLIGIDFLTATYEERLLKILVLRMLYFITVILEMLILRMPFLKMYFLFAQVSRK